MFKVEFTVRKKAWLSDPTLRWKAGLDAAGLQFRQRLQRSNYPPQPPLSTYIRTGTLANKANFKVYITGGTSTMFFGSTFYLTYLLNGTENWTGKKAEILQYMEAGFKQGIKDYKE